jgi:hypothetical protein
VLLVAGLLLAGLWALLALNTAAAADEVQARELASGSTETQDQLAQLKIDIAAKKAPAVLASEAAKLGLVPDTNPVFLSIAPNGSVVVLGTPQKVTAPPVPTPTPTSAALATTTALPTGTPATGATPVPGSTSSPAPTATPTSTPSAVATSTLPGGVR